MDQRVKKLLGEGPYPFSTDDFNNDGPIEAFTGRGMIILSQKYSFDMPKGTHHHSSYEFLIPLSDTSYTSLENRHVAFDTGKLFPINSEQSHGFYKPMENCHIFAFQIDKDAINEVSIQLYKKNKIEFKNESINMGSELNGLLQMFMNETRSPQPGTDFALSNITNLIIFNVLRDFSSNAPKLFTEKNYCERDNINRAINFLREEFSRNFSLEDVANIANLSPYHFIRIFKSITGKTPYNYLLDIKIEKSIELLALKNHTITEICFLCGFNNLEHFSSVFKRKVGILPSQYRKIKTE